MVIDSTISRIPSKRSANGFTLVELLVVIAIIATLASMGLLAAQTLRGRSKMTACASNLRNIGLAMHIYAMDNGTYPDTTHSQTADKAWIYQLESYLGKFDEVRICPADPMAKQRLANKASSYILNNSVFVADIDEMSDEPTRAFNKPSLLPDPANTILVFTISNRKPPYPGEDHTHSDHWSSWAAVLRDISPDRHLRSSSKDSTKGSSNYLYADSSVQTHTAIEIKKHITSGKNIGLIPGIRN